MKQPSIRDYYGDLGIVNTATLAEIKRAHRILARKHHPDKQVPGTCTDATEFRQIQEAYEYLRDEINRARYDTYYSELRERWARYRKWEQEESEREETLRAAEDEKRRQAEKAERVRREEQERQAAEERASNERKAAAEEFARQRAKQEQAAREKREKERLRELREQFAERRSREAASRARELLEQAAKQRLWEQKEAEAERRSLEAAERASAERQKAARERLKMMEVEEKQEAIRDNWARMRGKAEEQGSQKVPKVSTPLRNDPKCEHPRFGWPRKKGQAVCAFCEEKRAKFSFRCPMCDVAACPTCKNRYCIM